MIEEDWTIDFEKRIIYHSSGTTIYNVNEFYSWLMRECAKPKHFCDSVPITWLQLNPVISKSGQRIGFDLMYVIINGWYIDKGSFEYLKNGVIRMNTSEIYCSREMLCD